MILYFSATGNCRYVANCIAEEVDDRAVSIVDYIEKKAYEFHLSEGENIGIVSPTYAFILPLIVKEFLDKISIVADHEPYVYFVATYGTTPGQTGYFVKRLLEKRNIILNAAYGVKMPDTWTPTFDLSDPVKVAKINVAAEKRIDIVIGKIKAKKEGNFQFPKSPHFTDKIAAMQYERMRETRHFHVEDSCIGCGLCEKKCPAKVIQMKENKPIWVENKCYMCLGCLHRCPKFSIQYGNRTKKHGQYLHPSSI